MALASITIRFIANAKAAATLMAIGVAFAHCIVTNVFQFQFER
jgi:hypothetical protein